MFSNEELKQIMALAGVKNIPKLSEQDHIDLEIMVEPDESPEAPETDEYGVPKPLAPTYEEEPMGDEGETMTIQIPKKGLEMPMGDPQGMDTSMGEPQGIDTSMGEPQGMDISMGEPQGMDISMDEPQVMDIPMDEPQGEEEPIEIPMGGDAHAGHMHGHGEGPRHGDDEEMLSAFSHMDDDDFMAVILGGIPDMEEKMQEFSNFDGDDSPVGSDENEMESSCDEDMYEIEEEYDLGNGYDEHETVDGEDYFPNGHDSNVRRKFGPIPKSGDNNLNTSNEVSESLYKKYKDDYAKFLKEGK